MPDTSCTREERRAEKWYGTKANYRELKVFGCIAHVRKSKIQVNSKFDSRSRKCVLLRYADNGYRLWSLDEKKIIVACDVIFDENKRSTRLNDNSEFYLEEDDWKNNIFENYVGNEGTQDDLEKEGNDNVDVENEEDEIIEPEVRDIEPIATKSGRIVTRPAYLENYALSAYRDDVPQNYSEIEGRRDRMKGEKLLKEWVRKQNLGNNRMT
jgi:hypothetical protein